MALNLTDFNKSDRTVSQMRVEAFQPRVQKSPAANSPTINTIASLGAALEPNGNLEGAYKTISNELSYSTSSGALDAILNKWTENDVQGSMDALREVLINPNISDEEKQAVLYAHNNNMTAPSLSTRVAISAAEVDSEGETIEGSDLRAMIAAGYDEVDEYHAWAQKQFNTLNNEANPQFQNNVKVLVESFVPFLDAVDAAMFENLVNVDEAGGAVNTLQTLFALGEGKNRLRQALDKMPVEQRKPVVEALIGTIKSMNGTIATDTTALRAIRNLEQMVGIGGYSQADRWADDFFSVLDATILLSPVKGIARSFKGASNARLNEEVLRRGEEVAETVSTPQGQLLLEHKPEPLMIEYKPSPVSYGDDIEDAVNRLPVEATSKEINDYREALYNELSNPDGFSVDNVIDRMSAADRMTSAQISEVRNTVSAIAAKRGDDLNGVTPAKPVTFDNEVEEIINGLPIEPTSVEIDELRSMIQAEVANPEGFNIENVINNSTVFDKMNSTQIKQVRGNLRDLSMKRHASDGGGSFYEVQKAQISGNVQPTSISQIYKDVNPQKARAVNAAMVQDESGRAAEVLYGTDRNSAIANDFGPDIGGSERIRHKLDFEETDATPDPKITKHVDDADGAIWASDAEKAVARKIVINDWKNVNGLTNRSAMQTVSSINPSVTEVANGIRFDQVYGPKDHGFSNAVAGKEVVKAALRRYGVKDSDITVLSRQPDGMYGPVKSGEDLTNGDFVVRVKYDYKFDPSNINYDGFDISPLWGFLRIPDIHVTGGMMGKEGGLTQMIIPKAVNIDKNVYEAGTSAADKANGLQQQMLAYGKKIADGFKKLDPDQKVMVDQYIRLANDEELVFNPVKIKAAGINDEGLQVLSDWKTLQDTLWVLENKDVNLTLRNRGYEYFMSPSTDTQLLIKPIQHRGSNVALRNYLKPDGTVGRLDNKELDELYEKGGYIGELRKPEKFNGEEVNFVVVKNTATEGYGRMIRDDDVTLGYRHGYYHVKYTDPYYITARGKDGVVRTIARSDNLTDVNAELARLRSLNDGVEYDYKHDRSLNIDANFDDELDVAFNSGRSSQKLRGKRLDRIGHDKTISDSGMESPVDSLVRSIASISNRTMFRNVIDAEKKRWMSSFKHLLPKDRQYMFPEKISDIRSGPGANEARHAWRHAQSLQDGYANRIDDASKIFFNKVADVASSKGFGWVEKLSRGAARTSPSSTARLTAFRLFLASNPLGQIPLQMAPALPIIASLNPTAFGKVFKQGSLLAAWHRGVPVEASTKVAKFSGVTLDEMKDLIRDYELSGMSSAVNAHSYIADDLARLADRNVLQQAGTVASMPLRFTQKIGFDFGEQSLMTMVWISERDRMLKQIGKKSLDAADRERLTAKVRAITGDMNRGGDMPYNSNSFSVIMQFLQNPHKMASNIILGHKSLNVFERARLALGYTLTFGVPPVLLADKFIDNILPPEEIELREAIKGGMTNLLFNRFMSSMTGEDVNVDISGRVQPLSTEPMTEFIGALLTESVGDMIGGRAAPSLLGERGRISNFIHAAIAPFVPGTYENVDEFKQIGLTFMQMFTGTSNYLKAQYMLESGKIVSAQGQTVDSDISFMEALMKAAGFQTMDEVNYWASNKLLWEAGDALDADIKTLVDGLFAMYTRENLDVTDMEQFTAVMGEASRVFKDNPVIMNKVADYYKMKIRSNPDTFYRTILRNSGLYDVEEVIPMLNNSNLTREQIETVQAMFNIAGESYGR